MKSRIALSIILSFFVAGIAYADGFIVIPRPPQERIFIPLSIKYHHVEVTIKDQVTKTKVDQVFLNENNMDLEGIYIFPLPVEASISNFVMYVDGKPVKGEILEKSKARQIYDDIVRQMRDPALLEYIDRGAFRVSIYPIQARGEKRIQLEYSEVLKYDSGLCKYVYPLNTEKFSAKPIPSVTVSVDIKSGKPIKSVYSPSHEVDIRRQSDNAVKLSYEVSNVKPDKDFVMYYTVSDKEFGLNLISYKESDEDGFFMLLIAPKYETTSEDVIEKDVIFVLDKSGSMQGEKIDQAKNALKFCVKSLKDKDRFGIIVFSTDVDELDNALLTATKANIDKAERFIDKLEATGGTDINDALLLAIKKQPDPNRPKIIVFLTDGLPTIGIKDVDAILKNAEKSKSKSLRLFAFGVGYDVNTHFLDKLAEDNGGTSQYVKPSEDIEVSVSSFYNKISEPMLSNLKLATGSIKTREVYPKSLPDIFKGIQLVVLGRYENSGTVDIKLDGDIRSKKYTTTNKADFPAKNTENDFIPRLWAQRKVGYLLDEMRTQGDNNEIKDEIIHLSKKYGIITPYTSFLVLPEEELNRLPAGDRRAMARQSLDSGSVGLKKEKGADAVAASKMMSEMKQAPAPTVSNKPQWLEDSGIKAEIKYVGTKTFILKKDIWTDTEYEPEMKVTEIKYGSDKYFDLLSKEPELGKFFALGKNVIICYKGNCYKIKE
jgi:Ca-activated chloride channel family protein